MTLLFPLLKSNSNLIYTAIFSKILYSGLPLQSEIVEVFAISIWFNKFFFLSKLVSLSLSKPACVCVSLSAAFRSLQLKFQQKISDSASWTLISVVYLFLKEKNSLNNISRSRGMKFLRLLQEKHLRYTQPIQYFFLQHGRKRGPNSQQNLNNYLVFVQSLSRV